MVKRMFRCTSGCKSKIVAHVTLMFPLDKNGDIQYESDAKMVEENFVCSSCGEYVRPLTGHDLMKVRFKNVTSGEFMSEPRGKEKFDFHFSVDKGTVECPLSLFDWEADFLAEVAEEEYRTNVLTLEVIDVGPRSKELRLENLLEKTVSIITVEGNTVVSDRKLNRVEKNLVADVLKRGI